MADKRAFAVFDVGYLDNPKVMDVFDASCIAVCMHFASVMYCAQHLTDGYVTAKAMRRKTGGTEDDVALLLDAGLWHEPGHDCETCPEVPAGKVYVHDYLEHNRTSDGVKGRSAIGKKAAEARWNKQTNDAPRNAKGNASRMHDAYEAQSKTQCEIDADAMPRQTDRQTELKDLSTTADEFEEWYSTYPRKEAKEAARKAFKKARKSATVKQLTEGLERYNEANRDQDRKFIALPATWLNAGRWEDEQPQPNVHVGPWSKEFHA